MIAARDGHRSVLERLAQNLQHVAREFGEFIEKQHAVVRQADFAGPRRSRSAAHHDRHRKWCGAARETAVRAAAPIRCATARRCCGSWWFRSPPETSAAAEYRPPFRQHGLARARRPDHQYIVPARSRYLEGAAGGRLAAHVAKIRRGCGSPARGRIRLGGSKLSGSCKQRHHFGQMPHAVTRSPRAPRPPPPHFRRARSDWESPGRARTPPPKARRAPAGSRHRATVRPSSMCWSRHFTAPMAPRIPMAIGRSKPAPSLRMFAGARLMVTRLVGICRNPEFISADLMRCGSPGPPGRACRP